MCEFCLFTPKKSSLLKSFCPEIHPIFCRSPKNSKRDLAKNRIYTVFCKIRLLAFNKYPGNGILQKTVPFEFVNSDATYCVCVPFIFFEREP